MKKIAVLMGGTSSEREVSLQSGRNVAEALASLGKYDVVPVVLDADSLDSPKRIRNKVDAHFARVSVERVPYEFFQRRQRRSLE